ncbi:hypothetical protein HZS_1352 [Henneguya salminicola]|nr:hypothetical protein HZS_1352 [Henneguya salminicola]
MCIKYDFHQFIIGSHSKKRPNNIVIGRIYNGEILDMYEFGLKNYIPIHNNNRNLCEIGQKSCHFFAGHEFQYDPNYIAIKNIFVGNEYLNLTLDLWAPVSCKNIILSNLKHSSLYSVDSINNLINMRGYKIISDEAMNNHESNTSFECIGPCVDFELRRLCLPNQKIFRSACKTISKIDQKKRVKNIGYDDTGAKLASVHVGKQNLKKLKISRPKALKRKYVQKHKNMS